MHDQVRQFKNLQGKPSIVGGLDARSEFRYFHPSPGDCLAEDNTPAVDRHVLAVPHTGEAIKMLAFTMGNKPLASLH